MRRLSRFARSSGVALAAAAVLLMLPLAQGASAAASFSSTTPAGLATPGTTTTIPYPSGSGTAVTLKVQGFPATDPLEVLECSDPGGTSGGLPTSSSTCENLAQPATTDGTGAATLHYSVVVDSTGSGGATCDTSDYCVLWVGDDTSNLSGSGIFSAAFVFSPPTQAPEAPFAIALPVAGVLIGGGALYLYVRRRRTVDAA